MMYGRHPEKFDAATPPVDWRGRRPTQREIGAIVLAHARYLMRLPDGQRAQLNMATLSGLDLCECQLDEAELPGANLADAKLTRASLIRANLFSAILYNCNLSGANLSGADMRGASLRGADLTYSVLDGADLRAAFMYKVGGRQGYTRVMTPAGGSADGGVDFSNSSLKRTSLNGVNLKGANFTNAILNGVSFRRARLDDVCLKGAVITGIEPDDLPFTKEELRHCVTDPSRDAKLRAPLLLERIRLHELWARTNAREGEPAILDGEDLRPLAGALRKRVLPALSARRAIAVGVDFSGTELQGAQFEGGDMRDADFTAADLRGANFSGAKLAHARFGKADIGVLPLNGGGHQAFCVDGADHLERQFLDAVSGAATR